MIKVTFTKLQIFKAINVSDSLITNIFTQQKRFQSKRKTKSFVLTFSLRNAISYDALTTNNKLALALI